MLSVYRMLLVGAFATASLLAVPAWAQQDESQNDDRTLNQQQNQQRDADDRDDSDRQQNKQKRGQQDQDDRQRDDQNRQRQDQSQSKANRSGNKDSQGGLGVLISDTGGRGVEIERVLPGSPAEQAGIREGDRILSVNDQQVNSTEQLTQLISRQDPESQVQINLVRNGQRRNIQAQLATREQALPERITSRQDQRSGQDNYGRQSRFDRDGRFSQDDGRFGDRFGRQGDRMRDQRWADRGDQGSNRGGNTAQMQQQLSQLKNDLNRISRQVNQLEAQLAGRGGNPNEYRTRDQSNDYRTRNQGNDSGRTQPQDFRRQSQQDDDDQFPHEERYDSDFNRGFDRQ